MVEPPSVTFQAIGTRWDIRVHDDRIEPAAWQILLEQIRGRTDLFDKQYSRFRTDSLVAAMARKTGRYELPPDGFELLHFYEQLYHATGGKVTPLIGRTIAGAGYDATYSLQPKRLHQPPAWEDVLTYSQHEITLRRPALLDFGAAGKGYLVDIIGKMMEEASITSYTIDAGGDILHRGGTLEVGMENPRDTSEVIGTVSLTDQALCASAGSKRKWGNFHHIIDPDSLRSTENVLATWVMADTAMTADGLATALFFIEPAKLQKQFAFSYAVLDNGMGLKYAKNFPVTLFEA